MIYTEKAAIRQPSLRDSHRIQTCNLLIRSQMLYSVELANLLLISFPIYVCKITAF